MNKTFSRARRTLISSVVGLTALVSAGLAVAQDAYPNKPITWVCLLYTSDAADE